MRTPTGTVLHRRGLQALFASLLSAALPAFAGIADIITSDGSATRIEYASQQLRVTNNTADAPVMILRDGRVYMVQNTGGTPMVIDASQALSMFGNAASQMSPEMLATEVISLTATGARETHADITGEVYTLRYRTGDGKEMQNDVVLSNDPRALAFRDAIELLAQTMAKSVAPAQQDIANDVQARLTAMNMGVLRYGKDIRVTALSDTPVDASRFTLPAPPTDLSGLGKLLGKDSNAGKALEGLLGK